MLHPAALFTASQAQEADRHAMENGASEKILMENAGKAIVEYITQNFAPCSVLVLCGPGNNGGDGLIVSRLLKERSWRVTQASIQEFSPDMVEDKQLVVDALFGTGLSRNIEDRVKYIIDVINASNLPIVAVDIASGINADTGAIMGAAIRATHTVTFVRPKLGHVLLPGKLHTGKTHVADIGISGENITPAYFLNIPLLWFGHLPRLPIDAHKYTRGHALVMGGELSSTGASRLAARATLRMGSGLVSVACTPETLSIYATTLTAIMTKVVKKPTELATLLEDPHITAVLAGPGGGMNEKMREQVLQILSYKKPCVLDADALSSFKNNPKTLFTAIKGPVVITPHEGEFARLFSIEGTKPERAREAAKQSNAVVVLKGNDTIIASPDGRVAINANAPAWLATAGTGDVLAGLITGLLAQGMPAWEAACAGVGIHGEAANMLDIGMIAEDMPQAIPSVLKFLYNGG